MGDNFWVELVVGIYLLGILIGSIYQGCNFVPNIKAGEINE